jgi:hypothetical protein
VNENRSEKEVKVERNRGSKAERNGENKGMFTPAIFAPIFSF